LKTMRIRHWQSSQYRPRHAERQRKNHRKRSPQRTSTRGILRTEAPVGSRLPVMPQKIILRTDGVQGIPSTAVLEHKLSGKRQSFPAAHHNTVPTAGGMLKNPSQTPSGTYCTISQTGTLHIMAVRHITHARLRIKIRLI
jgi:hypothetical protein